MGANGSRSDGGFEDECLRAHNVYRARHGAKPLIHDPALSRTAQVLFSMCLTIEKSVIN